MKTADRIAQACKQDVLFNAFMVSAMINYANEVLDDKSPANPRSLIAKDAWQRIAQQAIDVINGEGESWHE
mgnify:CR=1 FL=1